MAIDDATFNALVHAAYELPNLAVRDDDGNFVRLATRTEIVNAATTRVERRWKIELDTGEYNDDDVRGIIEAYEGTHITAALGVPPDEA